MPKAQGAAEVHRRQRAATRKAPHGGAAQAEHLLNRCAGKQSALEVGCGLFVHGAISHYPRLGGYGEYRERPKNNSPAVALASRLGFADTLNGCNFPLPFARALSLVVSRRAGYERQRSGNEKGVLSSAAALQCSISC